ncbi:uncharacterized protein N7500_005993 [Penicillium coprophilum]|uniref:uncharacterized protein n=1 Tax=Penicillium coprophilum TaxID=36646 RepID=UPI00238CFE19|nr:uncharacterized protein N7500_005993 [Penicillium coprophilum]KAJ5164163.1 hypothetical protein N7500_005993 [Penicillium coprophilum]
MNTEADFEWNKMHHSPPSRYSIYLKEEITFLKGHWPGKSEWVALAQQREVAEGTAREVSSLKHGLATQEAQMGELRETNAKIAGDLQVTKEARDKLTTELEQETAQVVKYVQKKDWYSRTNKDLKAKYESLLAENEELVRGRENLMEMTPTLSNSTPTPSTGSRYRTIRQRRRLRSFYIKSHSSP